MPTITSRFKNLFFAIKKTSDSSSTTENRYQRNYAEARQIPFRAAKTLGVNPDTVLYRRRVTVSFPAATEQHKYPGSSSPYRSPRINGRSALRGKEGLYQAITNSFSQLHFPRLLGFLKEATADEIKYSKEFGSLGNLLSCTKCLGEDIVTCKDAKIPREIILAAKEIEFRHKTLKSMFALGERGLSNCPVFNAGEVKTIELHLCKISKRASEINDWKNEHMNS
jgi:hypothetical protein